jgi:hypothetical protein
MMQNVEYAPLPLLLIKTEVKTPLEIEFWRARVNVSVKRFPAPVNWVALIRPREGSVSVASRVIMAMTTSSSTNEKAVKTLRRRHVEKVKVLQNCVFIERWGNAS